MCVSIGKINYSYSYSFIPLNETQNQDPKLHNPAPKLQFQIQGHIPDTKAKSKIQIPNPGPKSQA